eukprot:CAMPEP_0119342396 /NCGR_PEP_ID=MMETSP1333-20130426/104608_1 /TAXON_ID=418940 /ORGANISM="Scyphosphaera apsteinii, Strain RCC1455" /LENGTH=81 /DNA_ID=CAMNT_0007354603 /DNA_START=774 /DNA_END=1019 /DNA_ORIENTATION=+
MLGLHRLRRVRIVLKEVQRCLPAKEGAPKRHRGASAIAGAEPDLKEPHTLATSIARTSSKIFEPREIRALKTMPLRLIGEP